jgi:hypothetical protein
MDYSLWLEAVKANGMALEHVPFHYKDWGMCKQAVESNGLALRSVPDNLKTYNLCLEAVLNNPFALRWVPDVAKPSGPRFPRELKPYGLCLHAVSISGWTLLYVPEKFRTAEMCATAIRENAMLKDFVPLSVLVEMEGLESPEGLGIVDSRCFAFSADGAGERCSLNPLAGRDLEGLNPYATEYVPIF